MRVGRILLIGMALASGSLWHGIGEARAADRDYWRCELGRRWHTQERAAGRLEQWERWLEQTAKRRDRDVYSDRYESRRRLAVEPYWAYPPEFYILRGHPSQYYYTFPDRYYTRQYYYPEDHADSYYRSRPYRFDTYGYREPYYRSYRDEERWRDYHDPHHGEYRDRGW